MHKEAAKGRGKIGQSFLDPYSQIEVSVPIRENQLLLK